MSVSVSGHFSPQIPLQNANLWLFVVFFSLCTVKNLLCRCTQNRFGLMGLVFTCEGCAVIALAGLWQCCQCPWLSWQCPWGQTVLGPGSASFQSLLCLISQAGIAVPQAFVQGWGEFCSDNEHGKDSCVSNQGVTGAWKLKILRTFSKCLKVFVSFHIGYSLFCG